MQKYLRQRAAVVEEALKQYLPCKDNKPQPLMEALHYSVLNGGKRLRPILLLETGSIFNLPEERAMPLAAAVEFIHCYSLVHDDLPAMDDDDLRRGKPTLHRVYDPGLAILTGDALLTLAFELLFSQGAELASTLLSTLGRELAVAAGWRGMVGGQVADLEAEGNPVSEEELNFIHQHKTGALLRWSVRAGAMLGGASAEELQSLTAYAESLGLLFQVTDDILDVEGESEKLGKEVGSDVALDKATFPALFGLEASRRLADREAKKAHQSLQVFGARAELLSRLVFFVRHRDY